jgi:hypothetical protein
VFATEVKYQFDLDSQSLSSALVQFSKITNSQYIVSSRLIKDISIAQLVGSYTPEQAMKVLLNKANWYTSSRQMAPMLLSYL